MNRELYHVTKSDTINYMDIITVLYVNATERLSDF